MKTLSTMKKFVFVAAISTITSTASAQSDGHELTVIVSGVNANGGNLQVVLCTEGENFPNACAMQKRVKATAGMTKFSFENVPDGKYAFAAFHDENDDSQLNFSTRGMPKEGLIFSKNAMGRMGPPSFKSSAFQVNKDVKQIVKVNYMK